MNGLSNSTLRGLNSEPPTHQADFLPGSASIGLGFPFSPPPPLVVVLFRLHLFRPFSTLLSQ